MARYLVFGHLTIDDTVMPDGRTAMGSAGGNVLYATIGARMWSDDVAMVARVGQGYPSNLISELAAAGYSLDGLVPCARHSIRQWQLYDCEGGRQYVPLASSGSYHDLAPRPEDIPAGAAAGAVGCHIAPMPMDLQLPLIEWARRQGLRVILDPHHACVGGRATVARWKAIVPLVDAFCPSRDEAESLLGGWSSPQDAVHALAEWGAAVVCLKLGADGVLVYRAADQSSWHIPSIVAHPVDTTGCGDAFCGGFLVGWCETENLAVAARYGVISASYVAADFGARHAFVINRQEGLRQLAGLSELSSEPSEVGI